MCTLENQLCQAAKGERLSSLTLPKLQQGTVLCNQTAHSDCCFIKILIYNSSENAFPPHHSLYVSLQEHHSIYI